MMIMDDNMYTFGMMVGLDLFWQLGGYLHNRTQMETENPQAAGIQAVNEMLVVRS